MFRGIETERLSIRSYTLDDVEALNGLRNDPDVARYGDWELPVSMERSTRAVTAVAAMDGPTADAGWNGAVCERDGGRYVGDVYVGFKDGTRTAEIGYSLIPSAWGRGYAVEAATALVAYLYEQFDPTRICGMLHPDNPASAMVLERVGMLFEGHTKRTCWVGDDCSDDWIYGMTRPDWESWRDRPRQPPTAVELVPITAGNERATVRLATHQSQKRFVATMLESFADALFPESHNGHPVVPVLRTIVADDEAAGFLMYTAITDHHPEPYLWRLLVDRRHQRRGIGRLALQRFYDELRAAGATSVETSWVPGRGSPEPLYLAEGFVPTGEMDGDEIIGRKVLS